MKLIFLSLITVSTWLFLISEVFSEEWIGNFTRNPGFEEDFVNANAEGHVISFNGDWYYNQRDMKPDYWKIRGEWKWGSDGAQEGERFLKLGKGAHAQQVFQRVSYQSGGTAWSPALMKEISIEPSESSAYQRAWRVKLYARGGGKVALGGVSVELPVKNEWVEVELVCPPDKCPKAMQGVVLKLHGPGEFDQVRVEEALPASVNLASNSSFEKLNDKGYPLNWSGSKKYRALGPFYYIWTDWHHFFEDNRGGVQVDDLVFRSGSRSLRFDVYPGDEKKVVSDLIVLNQKKSRPIEVGVYVRADRIKLIDIRCQNEKGVNLKGIEAKNGENMSGGTAAFGNGTFGWRYVRKYFRPHEGQAIKGVRVQLAARGFNGEILDDSGTRSYCLQSGTVWWDDLQVFETAASREELLARKADIPSVNTPDSLGFSVKDIDLGERMLGDNELKLKLLNMGADSTYQLELEYSSAPDRQRVIQSPKVKVKSGSVVSIPLDYRLDALHKDFEKPGFLKLKLHKDGKALLEESYAFHTYPVKVDFDISRHYSHPEETPMTVSMNFGYSQFLLEKVANLQLELLEKTSEKVLHRKSLGDFKSSHQRSLKGLPEHKKNSFEFGFPKPDFWTDKTNLVIAKVDLSKMKIWPHDQPHRDTVLVVKAFDKEGKLMFSDRSEAFGRMQAPPRSPSIKSVAVRDDGAILINGKPRFIKAGYRQNLRIDCTPEILSKLGVHSRTMEGHHGRFDNIRKFWKEHGVYATQMKPVSGSISTRVDTNLTEEQKREFERFVQQGGLESVVSVNTGGFETLVPDIKVNEHVALNEWIRGLTKRPVGITFSGAFNAWFTPKYPHYDIYFAETEMWGPMDYNTAIIPNLIKKRKKPTAWVYLPQLYDNTSYERLRFETYENIVRGSAGYSFIQGIGDPTFNRGLAGELRYLDEPLQSLDIRQDVEPTPLISHKARRHEGKTYILATNAGPVRIGNWTWNDDIKHSGRRSHEGDSQNIRWKRPGGMRLHGFRGLPMPEKIEKGDKIVQAVWLDPKQTPEWAMLAVRGDGKFIHNQYIGNFDYAKYIEDYGNIFMYSELNHSVWHEIGIHMDEKTYRLAVERLGKKKADALKRRADMQREHLNRSAYQAHHFKKSKRKLETGKWIVLELDAEEMGLVGKLVDGFAYMTRKGRALWDKTALIRNGKVKRVFCEDSVGIDRELLGGVSFKVPGLKKGQKVKVLFENRVIAADEGSFRDDFRGVESYGREAGGIIGDLLGFVADDNRELGRMVPSGYGYTYGPTSVHIYEITH